MPEEIKNESVPVALEIKNDSGESFPLALNTVKKGKTKGTQYYGLHPRTKLVDVLNFFGADKFWEDFLKQKINSFLLMLTKEATTDSGERDIEQFQQFFLQLSPRGATMADLRDRMAELIDQLADPELAKNPVEMAAVIQRLVSVKGAMDQKKVKKEDNQEDEENTVPVTA